MGDQSSGESTQVANRDTLTQCLRLIATGDAVSRVQLARATGMARSTVSSYVAALLELEYIQEGASETMLRGRPATLLSLGPRAPRILVVDLSVRHTRVALFDLGESQLREATRAVGTDDGVSACIAAIVDMVHRDLKEEAVRLAMVVASIPAPVNLRTGVVAGTNLPKEWAAHSFAHALESELGARVIVENDANLMALGESLDAASVPLIYAHLSHGIGVGIVTTAGDLHVGADGIAGDVGHAQLPGYSGRRCRCGKSNCVGVFTNMASIISDLGIAELGPGVHASDDLVDELRRRFLANDEDVLQRVREVSRAVGGLLAVLVDFYNPATLVLGGELTTLGDTVLSGVRGTIYEDALPAATGRIAVRASMGPSAILRGGARRADQLLLDAEDLFDRVSDVA